MNKHYRSILSGLLLLGTVVFAPGAEAGFNIGLQKITEIGMANGNMAYVEFDGFRNNTPQCSSGDPNNRRYSFNATDDRGKALLSILTAAMYAQRPVYATGTGSCNTLNIGPGGTASIEALQHVAAQR